MRVGDIIASPRRHSCSDPIDGSVSAFLFVIEKTPPEKWQRRCDALDCLVGSIPTPLPSELSSATPWYQSADQLQHLTLPLSQLLRDPRSSVVKRTCQNLTTLLDKCRSHARLLMRDLFPSILAVHAQTIQVIRNLCQSMIAESLPKVPCKASLPLLMERLAGDKSRWVREACALYICIALTSWNRDGYLPTDLWHKVGVTLLNAVHDAHPTVRKYSKDGLAILQQSQPAVFQDLEFETKNPKLKKWIREQVVVNVALVKDFLSVKSGGADGHSVVTAATHSSRCSVPQSVVVSTQKKPPRSTSRRSGMPTPRTRRTPVQAPQGGRVNGNSRTTGATTPPAFGSAARRDNGTVATASPLSPTSLSSSIATSIASPSLVAGVKPGRRATSVKSRDCKVASDPSIQQFVKVPASPKNGVTIALATADEDTISLLDESLVTARPRSPTSPSSQGMPRAKTLWPDDDIKSNEKKEQCKWKAAVVAFLLVVFVLLLVVTSCWQLGLLDTTVSNFSEMMIDGASERTRNAELKMLEDFVPVSTRSTPDVVVDDMSGVSPQETFDADDNDANIERESASQDQAFTEMDDSEKSIESEEVSAEPEPTASTAEVSANDILSDAQMSNATEGSINGGDEAGYGAWDEILSSEERAKVRRDEQKDEDNIVVSGGALLAFEREPFSLGPLDSSFTDGRKDLSSFPPKAEPQTMLNLTFLPWAPFRAGKVLRRRPSLLESDSRESIAYLLRQRMALTRNELDRQVCQAFRNETTPNSST